MKRITENLRIRINNKEERDQIMRILEDKNCKWRCGKRPLEYQSVRSFPNLIKFDNEERFGCTDMSDGQYITLKQFIKDYTKQKEMNRFGHVKSDSIALTNAFVEELKAIGFEKVGNQKITNVIGIDFKSKQFDHSAAIGVIFTLPADWDAAIAYAKEASAPKTVKLKFGDHDIYMDGETIHIDEHEFPVKDLLPLWKQMHTRTVILGYELMTDASAGINFGCKKGTVQELWDAVEVVAAKHPKIFKA